MKIHTKIIIAALVILALFSAYRIVEKNKMNLPEGGGSGVYMH